MEPIKIDPTPAAVVDDEDEDDEDNEDDMEHVSM